MAEVVMATRMRQKGGSQEFKNSSITIDDEVLPVRAKIPFL